MKDNKLIAEFMGLPKVACNIGTNYGCVTEGYMHPRVDVPVTTDGMQYKYSWDWLRPVMVKIDTYANSDSLSIAEYEDYRNKYPLIAEGSIYDDISETHKQVVEFIKSIQLPF